MPHFCPQNSPFVAVAGVLLTAFASGYVPITKMFKSGLLIDIVGIFLITIPIVMLLVKAIMGV